MTQEEVEKPVAPPKKKERTINVTPCPPAVSTGYLLLRAAVQSVVGVALDDTSVSNIQSLWMKQPNSAKFSVNLGKKGGKGELDLSQVDSTRVLEAIETAANRLAAQPMEIVCTQPTKQEIVDGYSAACLDGSHKKTKADTPLLLASMTDPAVAVVPALPYANTSALETLQIDRKISNIQATAKKCEITLQFVVSEQANHEVAVATATTDGDTVVDMAVLQEAKVRAPEGLILLEALQREQASKEAAAAKARGKEEAAAAIAAAAAEEEEMIVNTETVSGKIDYNRLVEQFGSTLISDDVLRRLEAQTVGKGRVSVLHRFLRRGMFFSHRDLDTLLTQMEKGVPMYLYTGRGPSSGSMHLGHLIPFLFTQWLQEALDVPLVIQMTDDEKFLFKGEYDDQTGDNLEYFRNLTIENARDIIACGFDYNKTFLFSDLDYVGSMYPNVVRIWKAVTTNTVNGIFGFTGSCNTGKIAFPAVQAAPSFASSFPTVLEADRDSDMLCLIPCAIDQDPYFRMTRDVAHKLVSKKHGLGGKPALIHSKFFPPLQGALGKMSSSDVNSAIFLTDTPKDIENKIGAAFSGGQQTKKEQEELGANLEIDVAYQWLRFFLEDDEELAKIGADYSSGSGEYWSTGKVKARLIELLKELVAAHQERRDKITDEEVRKWMAERSIV